MKRKFSKPCFCSVKPTRNYVILLTVYSLKWRVSVGKYTSEDHKKARIVQLFQDGQYLYHKGLKAYRERNLSRASKLIQRAIFLEPENTGMLSQLAVIYTEMGYYQQSNELLDFILKNINEKMTECYYFKANNYAHLGLFQEAYKAAETYLKEDPNGEFSAENAELLDLLDMGEDDSGYSEYDQDDLILKQDKAKSLLESGELQESIKILEEIIADYPEFWSAYNNLALAYFYAGDIQKAKTTIYDILEKSHGNLHALCNLLIFYHYERKDEKVRTLSQRLSIFIRSCLSRGISSERRFRLSAGTTSGLSGSNLFIAWDLKETKPFTTGLPVPHILPGALSLPRPCGKKCRKSILLPDGWSRGKNGSKKSLFSYRLRNALPHTT